MDSDPAGKTRTSRDSKVDVSSSESDSVQQGASGTESKRPDGTRVRGQRDSTAGHRWTPEEAEVYEKFRSTLKSKFQHLNEGVPNQGETRLLHEIYTDLYITEGGGGVNDEHEVRQIERASWREAAQSRPIKCSDIFKPLSGHHKSIRTVLTTGVAGIGKTVSVQKFILDWTEGETNQDVHYIFPLPFRELNLMMDKQLSLVELIQHLFPEIKDLKILTNSKHKVMFIFDGLDECRLTLDFRSNLSYCDVTTTPVSVNVLLTNLIKRNLLPSALLWITTRPAAASQIPPKYVDQVTEIRGFNDPQKEKYFRKRISDENLALRTITHLKSSRSLYIMCHIPVFCWISATVVERTSFESEKVGMPRTLTQMYTHFLIIQTSIKNVKYTERKETDEEIVFKLAKMAFQQLEKGNLIFYEEDLRECAIDVTEASVYSGVCTQIFREESGLYQGKVFSFVHLSIQEFLAALYVFICFRHTERSMSDQQQTSQLSALFRAATLHDLHKTAVDLALQSENGYLDLFLRFLLGLSLESNQELLMHLLPQTRSQPQSYEQTVQYIKQKIRDQHNSNRMINLFYCLNELNRHAVVEVIDRSSGTLSVDMLLPGQWETRRFRFKMPEEQLDEFDLQKYIKTPETDETELLSPDEVLQRLVPVVTSAQLSGCSLTEKSCAVIASAARSNSCSLKELNLSWNELHDAGVQHLSELLKNPLCKLEKLELIGCFLTEKSCAVIASAARSNSCSLKELHLSSNELHDAGVQHLSELLKNPHCKLEKLELMQCSLTEKSCAVIASAARSNSCSLKELNLSWNELHDAGVQHLSELFKNPHCKLETLVLIECSLTEKSCAVIASAARSNSCSLKELNLRDNELHDAGVQHLSELLKNPLCKLEKLVLFRCSLTEKSCAVIASAARSNSCSLKELNLSLNELHDAGVQHLSELLKNPLCKLEKLVLMQCSLTEKSCAVIASAARSNSCSLKELNLSWNELHDAGVQHLSEFLKNPHCKLEKLKLMQCSLTEKSCAVIASAARSNSCSLKELNLRGNELHDAGVQHLSELFKNPHCKLEKLEVDDRIFLKESPAAAAASASSSHSDAAELHLRDRVDDRTFRKESPAAAAASASSSHSDAAELHLRDKVQQDPGAQLLSLDTHTLMQCSLTEKSCAVIASAARSNSCSLKELNLRGNELHDAGVQHLSELFKNPHCKLEKLEVDDRIFLKESPAAAAASASSSHSDAAELHLRDRVDDRTFRKESPAAAAASASSSHSDAAELHLRDKVQQDPGAQLLSLDTHTVAGRTFLKESPAAAAASASSSHSDAAELHLRDKVQQDPGAQLLSLDTHTEDHHNDVPQRSCESCAEVPDSSHWVLVKPEVSTEESVSTYSLSSPAGSYECPESGLRWTCAGPVTLQYHFTDWHVFAEELAHMQFRPAGPLMDIRVKSGELEEIHLPHFLCLGGSEASVCDAVRVLHGRESGVCVEVCELTRHHARLVHPSFSLFGVVYYLRDLISPKVHCELLLFCTCTAPLVLHTYLVPNDPAHIQAIHQKEEKRGVWVDKPCVLGSLREMDTFCVRTSCPSEIQPEKMNLWPLSTGNFCEVYMEQPEEEFDMEVFSSQQPIWRSKIRRRDYCQPSRSPGQGSSQGAITVSTTSTEEMPSGSSSPVQPASGSSSITAHTGGVAVAPSLSGNTFYGPVYMPVKLDQTPPN
ncbi:NACHT, LRR and PYD domains-containing protein 3-like isoform X2 [Sardina pilchardus]|uniref:NACHT, LRR and PYD domains-containing protein 3-like isoform X2 n=1 Tax=Sardina pilchardus TaxID=27697 RepID=UPI002E0F2B9E